MERGAAPPQLHPPADGRGEVHHAAAGRGGEEEARSSRAAIRRCSRPRLRRTSSRKCARSSKARYGAKQLYENGLTDSDRARPAAAGRRQPRARHGTPPHRSPARLPQAEAQRARGAPHDRGLQASALGSSVRRQRHRPRRGRRHRRRRPSICAPATSGSTIDKKGYAWTRKTTAAQLVTPRRSRRSRSC